MEFELNAVECRILGVLIEKQMATPEYYPLTLNALVNGCNQKSSREPVMNLEIEEVEQALDSLRKQHLVWQVRTHGSRVSKYEHNMKDVAEFTQRELAVLCQLLLRGPQTTGEIRNRTVRLAEFNGLPAVEHTLSKLMAHEKGPFAVKLPRQPGYKESRYAHLFTTVDLEAYAAEDAFPEPRVRAANVDNERIELLEKKVDQLQAQLEELTGQFMALKAQFE